MSTTYSKAYLSTQVNTSDPLSLVIALYETAISNVTQAIEGIETGDLDARRKCISRASEIIMALSEALDYTQQDGLAGKLFSMYTFMLRQLLEANRENEVEPLESVRSTLSILLEGWQHASRDPEATEALQARRNQTGAAAAQNGQTSFQLTA